MKEATLILIGFVIAVVLEAALMYKIPVFISSTAPIFIVSFCIGWILKEKGWLWGVFIACMEMAFVITILKRIGSAQTGEVSLDMASLSIAKITYLFISGALGGFFGEICRKKLFNKG